MIFRLLLISVLFNFQAYAADKVLVSWHDFSAGFQLYLTSGTAKGSTSTFQSVTGKMYGGKGSRDTWGSTDGTYGSTEPVGSVAADGVMALRTNGNNLDFTITNGGKRSLYLSEIVFDYASISPNAPSEFELYYLSGGLSDANNTLLQAFPNSLNGLGAVTDYQDISVPLTALSDRTLAPNQTATFRLRAVTAADQYTAMAVDNIAILGDYSDFAALTYNIHGGKGPDGEGTVTSNLTSFRDNYMHGEDVLCLQEVDFDNGEWDIIKGIFSDYPHTFQTINSTTKYTGGWSFLNRETSIAILSKHPFTSTHEELVQIDPTEDKWERHAQHVTIELGGETINLFNFHNTYNFNDNDWEYEKSGFVAFKNYVLSRPGINSVTTGSKTIMLGDFNLLVANVTPIINAPAHKYNGRDHVSSIPLFAHSGVYATSNADLSDHNAVWAAMDVVAPATDEFLSTAVALGPDSVELTAVASDPNAVQYLFKNSNYPGGGHNSGWQDSSVFVDTGLEPDTVYTYTVTTRDKSANGNASEPFTLTIGPISDTDPLPDSWEQQYFSNLSSSSGGANEDYDGDGATDLEEYNAGTDPTDAESRFKSWVESSGGVMTLKWTSVADRTYQIQSSGDLVNGWVTEPTVISATAPTNSATVESTGDKKFFRVKVLPETASP
ncbi:MAG: endonuclease/exonuclease/phosphatase family protein [Akkermansiaceae bacterium]